MEKMPNVLANIRDLWRQEWYLCIYFQVTSAQIIQNEWFHWFLYFFSSIFKSQLAIRSAKQWSFHFKHIFISTRAFPGGQLLFKLYFLHGRKQSEKEKWLLSMKWVSWTLHSSCSSEVSGWGSFPLLEELGAHSPSGALPFS